MRRYRSMSGKTAEVETTDESYGFYRESHVICTVSDGNSMRFGSYAEAFAWLVDEYGEGWLRK